MIQSDYHVHSNFSSDSKATMESMVEQAISLGFTRICFTDHMDYDFPGQYDLAFVFDPEEYFKKLKELKERYKDKITVLFGIECGLRPYLSERYSMLINSYPFDFVICSTHIVDDLDPYYKEFWEDRTKKDGLNRYFDAMIDTIRAFDDFDVYGHLDYIVRYVPNKDTTYDYEDYKDKIDTILTLLIEKDKGIEVNTAGYKYGLNAPNPSVPVIKRYLELGGKIISIGSDGHMPEHFAYDFEKVRELLLSLGITQYTVFEKRKPILVDL
ncbi:MAG: histidinol-phosphatase HisJ family protein [bacterium]|nr:histidinol-phosphatase HisJ family protein [bacterium]